MEYAPSPSTSEVLRTKVTRATWQGEAELYPVLKDELNLSQEVWDNISQLSHQLISKLRADKKPPLIDQFLTEYGLSSDEGVQLMRLAEALSRAVDAETADQLINDKIAGGNWLSHTGPGHSAIMSMSGRMLDMTGKWLRWSERQQGIPAKIISKPGNRIVRQATRTAIRVLSSQFVFAETLPDAMKRAKIYQQRGYLFSFDMLGEAARTKDDAKKYYDAYCEALKVVARHAKSTNPARNHGISIKLSALHPRYEYAHAADVVPEIVKLLKPLALKSRNANIQLTIDAEEAERLDISMDVLSSLVTMPELNGWQGLGFVVQAYQRRALPLLDWLKVQADILGAPLMIRLVKGAYWDSEIKRAQEMGLESYPVFTRKETTDLSYLSCARKLLDHPGQFSPQFATHNAYTIAAVQELAGTGRSLEFQRLFGMGQQLHDIILQNPNTISRIYAPVGTQRDLLSYLIRRLLENGANSSFVHRLVDPDVSISELARSPADLLKHRDGMENKAITAPRDIFSGARLSAQGWDLSHREIQDRFARELAANSNRTWSAAPVIKGQIIEGDPVAIRDPADPNEIVGHCVAANREIAHQAMETASRAYKHSSNRSPKIRAAILNRAADLLEQRASLFHALAIREAGKSWTDAVAEVREAVDFCRYYASQSLEVDFEKRQSLGVIVCISPWNFPLAIFLGQVTAALAAGNTVVAKPAEQTPLIAAEAIRLLHDAGIAPAKVNLVPGDGPNIGDALIAHPEVAAVCFTGSTKTARYIARRLAKLGRPAIPLIAETGGINAMIVDSSALLEQTVDDVVASAFQSAGQRCSALRLLCVQEEIADELIAILRGAMEALRIGDPSKIDTDVGPVIDLAALKNIEANTQRLDQTAKLICALKKPSGTGNFAAPCAYEIGHPSEVEQEIFGPVLHVVRFEARDKQNIIDQINNLGYGLTLGIQSRVDGTSEKMARNAQVGNVYINRNQIGAVVGVQPFGGHGLSGTGPKAGGPLYLYRLSKSNQPLISPAIFSDVPVGSHGNASPVVTGFENLPNKFIAAMKAARKWDVNPDRENIFEAVFNKCGIEDRVKETAGWKQLSRKSGELASPVGETNIYRLRGRGVILSVLKDYDDMLKTCMKALLTGNGYVHISTQASSRNLKYIQKALAEYSKLSDLVQIHCVANNSQILGIIETCRFDALLMDDDNQFIQDAGRALTRREGPILPIILPLDGLDRYIHEQTITRNIADAGGNVTLLNA